MPKAVFEKLKKELYQQIHRLGGQVRIIRKRPQWGSQLYKKFRVEGSFHVTRRRITITVYGNEPYTKILHYLAHETRHLIHDRLGLYQSYYDKNNIKHIEQWSRRDGPIKWKFYNTGVATRAERDCDRWADNWLKSHGYPTERKLLYRHSQTAAYECNKYLRDLMGLRARKNKK